MIWGAMVWPTTDIAPRSVRGTKATSDIHEPTTRMGACEKTGIGGSGPQRAMESSAGQVQQLQEGRCVGA